MSGEIRKIVPEKTSTASDDIELTEKAIADEKEAIEFYKTITVVAKTPGLRTYARIALNDEEKHYSHLKYILEQLKTYLRPK